MIKEALQYIAGLGSATTKPQTVDIWGIPHTKDKLETVRPPMAEGLSFSSLKGFVDYCANSAGDIPAERLRAHLVHVASPWVVRLCGPLHSMLRTREAFAHAFRDKDCGFKWGERMEVEAFTIALMTLFDETPAREQLVRIVGNLAAETVNTSTDDGFSQSVAQRASVAMVKRESIKNPFELAPHRTFAEVAQPMSPFIFRVHQVGPDKLPHAALYECDNGAWKLKAIKSIAAWISGEFDKRKIAIPVLA